MYVCMYVCINIYVYIYVHVYLFRDVGVRYVYIYMYVYIPKLTMVVYFEFLCLTLHVATTPHSNK